MELRDMKYLSWYFIILDNEKCIKVLKIIC